MNRIPLEPHKFGEGIFQISQQDDQRGLALPNVAAQSTLDVKTQLASHHATFENPQTTIDNQILKMHVPDHTLYWDSPKVKMDYRTAQDLLWGDAVQNQVKVTHKGEEWKRENTAAHRYLSNLPTDWVGRQHMIVSGTPEFMTFVHQMTDKMISKVQYEYFPFRYRPTIGDPNGFEPRFVDNPPPCKVKQPQLPQVPFAVGELTEGQLKKNTLDVTYHVNNSKPGNVLAYEAYRRPDHANMQMALMSLLLGVLIVMPLLPP